MGLPKQVQKQLADAEALQKQIFGEEGEAPAAPTTAEVVNAEATQGEPKPQEPTAPEAPAAQAPAEPKAEAPEAAKPAKDTDDAAHWKQKYKTLQGMYDADVPRLNSQLKELTGEFNKLKESMADAEKARTDAERTAEYERQKNLVTDEDRQEFGEDLIEVQRKVAREELADLTRQIEALKSQNAELQDRLEKTGSEVTTASFEQRLANAVPDFQEVNTNPAWISWLNEVDPMLRAPRMVAAQKAYSEGDAEAVAHYVKLWKESTAPAPEPKAETSQEIENQIQPPRNAAPQTTPQPQGTVYTTAQIKQMFKRVTELGAMGRVDEARKLEAEIDAAYTEGRVAA